MMLLWNYVIRVCVEVQSLSILSNNKFDQSHLTADLFPFVSLLLVLKLNVGLNE